MGQASSANLRIEPGQLWIRTSALQEPIDEVEQLTRCIVCEILRI